MVRALGVIVFAGILLGASSAHAQFSMGEVAATTGMHQTLAATGMGNPAGTINTVKKALGAAAATKQGQLDGAAGHPGPAGWGGKGGGRGGWTAPGAGWKASASGGKGWTSASASWATGGGKGGGAWHAAGDWSGAAGGARAVN